MQEETKEVLGVVKEMFEMLSNQIKEVKFDLENQIKEVKFDLENQIKEVKQEVDELKQRVTNVEARVVKIETALENETNRNIRILVDGHIQNAEKLDKLDNIENDVEHIKLKTDVLESVTRLHSFDINHLKKAK